MKLTEGLSIYAALLSTIVFFWNMSRSIPRYKVDLLVGTDEIDGEVMIGAFISIKNPSSHAIHLSNISLLSPYKQVGWFDLIYFALKYRRLPRSIGWVHTSLSNYDIDDKCPTTIEPGQAHNVFVPHKIVETILKDCDSRNFKAVVQDQLWRNKYSRAIKYPHYVERKQ